MSVDALVADSAADFPPNVNDFTSSVADFISIPNEAAAVNDFDSLTSRTSTPSVPPGLALPHAHPAPALRDETVIKPVSRIVPTSAPFTPSRNLGSACIPRAATPLARVSVPISTQGVANPTPTTASTSQARQDVKALAANTGLAKTIASQSAQGMQGSILRPDDFPELEKGKEKLDAPVGPKSMAPIPKKVQTPINETSQPQSTAKGVAKRSTPGILNTATPSQPINKTSNESDGTAKTVIPSSGFPPLPPSAPSSAATQSPAVRNNPKTLRLVPTPKTEVPPAGTSTPQSATSTIPPNFLPPSRQPSIVSLTRNERPSTPVSEIISDNASITSNSLSRPSSPPATRVGSASVRSTTKSQQKKQRREAKEKSELVTVVDKLEPEVEIAPIMGRKKKQKKEKISSTAGGASPAISRAPSPRPQETIQAESSSKMEATMERIAASQTQQPELESAVGKISEPKGKAKSKTEEPAPLELPTPPAETADEHAEKPIPAPASILLDLVSSGLLPDPNKLVVFKSPVGFNQRLDLSGDFQDADQKLIITEEDRAALQAGKPVHKVGQGSNRIMLTPNGDCVRNLSSAEEERYLELQSRILDDAGPATFIPPRHTVSGGFALIGGRAVPNGPPAYFPPADPSAAHLDPVGKIQRDEALSYINQFVLPSLSTNSQLERALNANALDAEMFRPNDLGAWGAASNHPPDGVEAHIEQSSVPDRSYGVLTRDNGILATGLQSMTAHFALGQENGRTQPLGNVALLSLEDSEKALQSAKKETEKLEKSLNQLLKKNRRLLLGAGH
jgi:CCR4-NOT transcription complex subunit 4